MKSIVRVASVCAAFLAPFVASAQQYMGPGYTQSTSMFFSNGSVLGGMFGGGGGGLFGGRGMGSCLSGICGIGQTILYIINSVLVPLLFAVAFIVFLYGIARAYIFSHGEPEEVSKGHRLILWGLIAFVVMISVWGLVNVVANTFGLTGAYAPPLPRSY